MESTKKVFGNPTCGNCFGNVEIYTKNPVTGEEGWDIEFVKVYALTQKEVNEILNRELPNFDCVILY